MRDFQNLIKQLLLFTKLHGEDLRRRSAVLHVLVIATFAVLVLAFIVVLMSYVSGVEHAPMNRLIAVASAVSFASLLYVAMRKGYHLIAAHGLLIIYGSIATIMAVQWSIDLPGVSLLYCIVIVIAGMLIGARYAMYAACIAGGLLFVVQAATLHGVLHPNLAWRQEALNMFDLSIYYLVFVVLGVTSWLFNRQTDRALHQALQAEAALQRQRDTLEIEVEARTRDLQTAQIERIEQVYRFAQLGKISTSMLHDLGNHMSTLSLDLEGLTEQHERSQLQLRIKRRIHYIDNMVRQAYEDIRGTVQLSRFNVSQEIRKVTQVIQYDAQKANIQLRVTKQASQKIQLYGDASRFRQLLSNLIVNAIDAYDNAPEAAKRKIEVELQRDDVGAVELTVRDFGPGIPKDVQEKIFQPFYSTKYDGMGIGLFVVREIAEERFRGSVRVASDEEQTEFVVVLHGAEREKE